MKMLRKIIAFVCAMVAFNSFGAFAVAEGENRFVKTVYNDRNGLPTGEANTILQTSDGYIWIGSYGGLIRYDGTTFVNYSTMPDGLPSSSVRSLFEDSAGRLWVGTNDSGVYVYDMDRFTAISSSGETGFLCVRDFVQAEDGTIYIGSNSGAGVISDGGLIAFHDEEIYGQTVYSVGLDSIGRLWCAADNGVVLINDGKVEQVYDSDVFFKESEAYSLTSTDDGDIIIGSSGNELVRLDIAQDGSWTKTEYSTGEITTHNMVRADESGSILVSALNGAMVIFPDGAKLEYGEKDGATSINQVELDYEGNVWLVSSAVGVLKYSEGSFWSNNDLTGLDDVSLNAVEMFDGFTYAATDTGLLVFDQMYTPVENSLTKMLEGDRVRHVITDTNGRIWTAAFSHNAVCCYDPKDDSVLVYNTDNGLAADRVRTLYELSDGSVAAGTQAGISIIAKDGSITSYTIEDGLDVTSVLCFMETSDSLLAGSDGGGIYEIKDGKVIPHGFDKGLAEGVVLRMVEDGDGFFVSAGSSLYYWNYDSDTFRKLSNLKKQAGSIFDMYLRDDKLWILQNSGVLSVDKEKLLSGEETEAKLYGFKHGLTGSLNANTWHFTSDDGSLHIATRSGISVFGFIDVETCLPIAVINSVTVDGESIDHPESIKLKGDVQRITVDFAALSFTDASDFSVAYMLEGFDEKETILDNVKSGEVSYTNLPGGEYNFTFRVFSEDNPDIAYSTSFALVKSRKIYENAWFWVLAGAAAVGVGVMAVMILSRVKMERMERRNAETKKLAEESLRCLAHTIDAKDQYTNGHSVRVATYARELARRMGKSEDEQERIYYIGLLHDIGKIGIPDDILNKPGKLTSEEFEAIKTHVKTGREILSDFTAIDNIADGALYHHERYDGKGYCEGKRGPEIPEVARIIGVADTYDAMSSNRCYREALSVDIIISELEHSIGTQLDPDIVPYMLDMIKDGTAPVVDEK